MRTIEDQFTGLPEPQGLYDPTLERDACGVGFVVNIDGSKSHKVSVAHLSIVYRVCQYDRGS